MHENTITTVRFFTQYASPVFAQTKLNGKSLLLVDFRKIKTLIGDDLTNNNQPVGTLSDAAQYLPEKFLFCIFDCSQAYQCLQMVDQRSVKMVVFKLFRRTLPYRSLAKEHSRSVCAFSSFMRECLDPVVKTEQCAQYVIDIGSAVNNAKDLSRKVRSIFH